MSKSSTFTRGLSHLAVATILCFAALTASSLEAHAIGMMIPTEVSLPPLAIKSHRVNIEVTDLAAVTHVEQVFTNHTSRQLEATFYFPVPKGSTVSGFSLWINGKKTKGAVLERAEARAIYERIVRRTEDPGLIEYMDGTLFQARIFPVPARGDQKVEITFAAVMGQTSGMRQLIYPLKTGKSAARLLQDMTLVARIQSEAPLKAIYSPSHNIAVSRKSDHEVIVSTEELGADLERDFLLYMDTGKDDVGLSMLTYDPDGDGGEDGYYLMVLAPQVESRTTPAPKTISFVVDTSGSMNGEKMSQTRRALKACLKKLSKEDRFNIIRFSTDVEGLFHEPVPASSDNISRGEAFADRLKAVGGTSINEALVETLGQKIDSETPHLVLFMTDGLPTVGATDINTILSNVRRDNGSAARLFTIGVGFNVNTVLLDQLATEHRGDSDYIRPNEDIKVKIEGIYNKIAYPVMTNLAMDFGPGHVFDSYPKRLPDLFRGGQVTTVGRYRTPISSTLTLSGQVGNDTIKVAFNETRRDIIKRAGVHDFIPRIWATRKVGYLLQEIRSKGAIPELKREVIRLAKRYGLVTPYTSYLAVDDSEFDNRPPPTLNGPGLEPRAGMRAPAPDARKLKAKREALFADAEGMRASSGEDAVESSLATKAFKEAESAQEASSLGSRYIEDTLFVLKEGVWQQQDISLKGAISIRYLSEAWFNLIKARPDLRQKVSTGRRVALKVGDKVVIIDNSGAESISVETISTW